MESLLNKHGFPRVPFPFQIDDDTLQQRDAFLTRGMYSVCVCNKLSLKNIQHEI